MSGSDNVADILLLINFFNGFEPAKRVLNDSHIWVSVITEMELLSYPQLSKKESELIRSFIDECVISELSKPV